MKRLLTGLVATTFLLAAASVGAQNWFIFEAESRTIEYCPVCGQSGTFDIDLMIAEDQFHTTYPTPTQGFSMAIGYDDTKLELIGAAMSPYVLSQIQQNPDFEAINLDPGNGPGLTVGVVYSFFNTAFVPFALLEPAVIASFATTGALAGDFVGASTQLTWDNSIGNPPVENSVVAEGQSFSTDFVHGTILLVPEPGVPFLRGDCNGDGVINIVDPIFLGMALFSGAGPIACEAACDFNADGVLNIADGAYGFHYLFAGGPPPPGPFPVCGIDQNGLDCVSFTGCP